MKFDLKHIVYFPVWLLLHMIALLPYRVLYVMSDFLYLLVYYVCRYRVRVVRKNLQESFPTKKSDEIVKIERKFYSHFSDYIVETIKLLHVSDEEMRRRMVFENVEIVDESLDRGRSSIIYAGHYGNWEYLPSITLWSRHSYEDVTFAQIYRTLKNSWFDDFFLQLRGRFHSVCIEKRSSLRDLLRIKRDGKQSVTGFISDQHPSRNDEEHVIRFLNHDTAIITGSELLARKLDMDVFFFDTQKLSRGRYKTVIRKITVNSKDEESMAITDAYATMLENCIQRQPELWLWTHKRWKWECKHPAQPKTPLKENENE